jgi:hypothetical protein
VLQGCAKKSSCVLIKEFVPLAGAFLCILHALAGFVSTKDMPDRLIFTHQSMGVIAVVSGFHAGATGGRDGLKHAVYE